MTDLMDLTRTKAKAAKVPMPSGGEVITLRVDVALAFMKMHNLKKVRWDGGVLVLRRSDPPQKNETPAGDPNQYPFP